MKTEVKLCKEVLILFVVVFVLGLDIYSLTESHKGKIAFSSNRTGNFEIFIMNADGTTQINVTNHSAFDRTPSWSPDGEKIAFESNRNGNWDIFIMNADGTTQINVTNNPYTDKWPSWSPHLNGKPSS
jgi:TolB protein